ncbi:MAG TPA: hypothetical protein VKB88_29950 [Bryobacteraceae bacterium]|nr:hypothetical protein [Bryobacteraceae bacterium]
MRTVTISVLIARVRQTTGNCSGAIQFIAVVILLTIGLPLLAKRPAAQEVNLAQR